MAMALFGGSLSSLPSPEITAHSLQAGAITEIHVPDPLAVKEISPPMGLPGITIETANTPAQRKQQFTSGGPQSDVAAPEPAAESPSALEDQVRTSLDIQQLDDAKLAVVDIVPSSAGQLPDETSTQSSRAPFVFLFLTRGDGCATAFAAIEGDVDNQGQLIVSPVFAGRLPQVATPVFYNSAAMFRGRDIIQAETGEYLLRGSLDNTTNLAIATQTLCNAYLNNRQVAETNIETDVSTSS